MEDKMLKFHHLSNQPTARRFVQTALEQHEMKISMKPVGCLVKIIIKLDTFAEIKKRSTNSEIL